MVYKFQTSRQPRWQRRVVKNNASRNLLQVPIFFNFSSLGNTNIKTYTPSERLNRKCIHPERHQSYIEENHIKLKYFLFSWSFHSINQLFSLSYYSLKTQYGVNSFILYINSLDIQLSNGTWGHQNTDTIMKFIIFTVNPKCHDILKVKSRHDFLATVFML